MTMAIKRVSLTQQVADSIQKDLQKQSADGSYIYEIGQKIPTELEWCERLNVSRTSIREATRLLQAKGFIEVCPGKGSFLKSRTGTTENWYSVDSAKFSDYVEVRLVIETLSVRLAIERADDQQIFKLQKICHSFESSDENNDSEKRVKQDERFHAMIISIVNNPLLVNFNKQLVKQFHQYRLSTLKENDIYQNAKNAHKRIMACFEQCLGTDKDDPIRKEAGVVASQEMEKHLQQTLVDMEKLFSQ